MRHLLVISLFIALLLVGCQSFQKKIEDTQARLMMLENKGLPDSLITPIRISITAAQGEMKRNRGGNANKNLKAAITAVKKAEEVLENSIETKKPEIIARYNSVKDKVKKDLRALHKYDADSALAVVDSFIKIDFVFKAEAFLEKFEKDYPKLLRAQFIADSLRPKVQGTWTFIETTKNSEDKNVNAIEKKIFSFNKGGNSKFVEEKHGQSSTNLKEDWKFETWGTWDMKGDTVWVIATKFIQNKQTFWQFNELTKKWGHVDNENKFVDNKPNVIEAETLTIEKNKDDIVKQNRYIIYQDLLDEYKKQ
ncbi:MAG: hypothetical protein LBH98_01465 [Chitinispirillales bacterium]|jgi:hypothetical protein|nr:hypothetical protein [Chitinispirillales bacterium]